MSTAPASPIALAETDTLRNATLNDLAELLRRQADLRYDVVVTADKLRYDDGVLVVDGGATTFGDDGDFHEVDARLRPTAVAEEHLAQRFEIPVKYLRRIREQGLRAAPVLYPDFDGLLLDHTINAHLQHEPSRKFLLRAFRTDDPASEGIVRAVLSDRYGAIDNLDVLLAALDGVAKAGVKVDIDGCDLSERRMQVRISAPEVTALAPVLTANYRSPFRHGGLSRVRDRGLGTGADGSPIVFAGFVISNSETGGGACTLTPRITLLACDNGLTVNVDAMREVHLGGRLDEGVIRWSADTQRKAAELVSAKAADAVAAFLDKNYVEQVVARIEEKAGVAVTEPVKVLERVAKQFAFTQGEQETILSAFITSGDTTAGGVLNAVTACAQTVADPDRAADLEAVALDVLDFVAA